MKVSERISTLLMTAGLLLFSGCSSTGRYQVNIGNGNQSLPVLQNVQVSLDEKKLKEFPVIAPQKIAATRPQRGDLPQTIRVEWTSLDGSAQTGEVQLAEVVPEDFKGQLVVQINPDNTLKLTQVPARSEELSPIPWNAPEAWEGSVMIPGFNQ